MILKVHGVCTYSVMCRCLLFGGAMKRAKNREVCLVPCGYKVRSNFYFRKGASEGKFHL
jgi:collagenase-like PrtC family protease